MVLSRSIVKKKLLRIKWRNVKEAMNYSINFLFGLRYFYLFVFLKHEGKHILGGDVVDCYMN